MAAAALPLAGAAGVYQEYAPPPVLARHLLCGWTNAMPADHLGPVAVVPDGCIDLLWVEDRLIVAGPDETVERADLPPGGTITGVRFRPGAAANWLDLPMALLVNRRVPLREVTRARAGAIEGRLGDLAAPEDRLARLTVALGTLAPSISPPAPLTEALFRRLVRWPAQRVAAIAADLGFAERSLHRHCLHDFGYGPKTLARIRRFQRFMTLAANGRAAGLGDLAFAAGYADQAHMSREVRRLAGQTPAAVRRQYHA
jgi:AraC-like DNA-binding protein